MTTNDLKFSIIIPTYNRSNALDRCLQSLVNQTYKNFEVLICDDGSTDNTSVVVEKYRELLTLRYFYQENWGGPARSRNVGITNSVADWLCFLDSDDWYTEGRLEFISNQDLNKIDFIYHDLEIISNDMNTGRIKSRQLNNRDVYHDLLYNLNAIPTSSTCIRKCILEEAEGFRESKDIIGLEDFDLWIRLGKLGMQTKYFPVVMGSYFIGDNNITFSDDRQISRFRALYASFIKVSTSDYEKNKIAAALAYNIGNISLKNGDITKGYISLVKSLLKGSLRIKTRSIYHMINGLRYMSRKNNL
ncbi:glycosyltransferase family 2 protein [Pedobacter hartonius]|uniref:Glycosyltransferase involved in cell wall bisynthesis n=1 Tax=Pedobacter hartonius TaxID=425514 RepID=A0A1H4FQZ9_9SPHI|nr:glycosyltransferase [Pedobacter hartonius]SEA99714.1 Glycosyltransferase involved in cell wall bisynthesis [Pedobacter hartonius]